MPDFASIDAILAADTGVRGRAFALLRQREQKPMKNGGSFFLVEFADSTGSVTGKIWPNAEDASTRIGALEPGTPVKVEFEVGEYQGIKELNVQKVLAAGPDDEGFDTRALFGDGPSWVHDMRCRSLVFDIETVPATATRELPSTIVKSLTQHAERREMDEAAVMGLSPWFGKVVTLAFGEGESAESTEDVQVLAVPREGKDDLEGAPDWVRPVDEPDLLRAFWSLASLADVVVSFNGRGFDIPFLVGRSLVHGIDARVDLLSKPFTLRPHLDLLDLVSQRGRGPANLDVVCWALGITSPKGEMDGSMVAPAYERGDLLTIAEYNREDVRATAEVYQTLRDRVLRYRRDWSST